MSVNIIWSLTNGGVAITDTLDHGNSANGDMTSEQEIFIRHDGSQPITNVGFYIRQLSGTYTGSHTASKDINEIIGWGNETTLSDFGGIEINMKRDQPSNTFDSTAWPIYSDKDPEDGKTAVFHTGVGDSEGNAVLISSASGASDDGEIQSGASPNISFLLRIVVPDSEDTLGIRQWEQVVRFNFTS